MLRNRQDPWYNVIIDYSIDIKENEPLLDARDREDEAVFKKLMQSAHRRGAVNSAEVDEKFS